MGESYFNLILIKKNNLWSKFSSQIPQLKLTTTHPNFQMPATISPVYENCNLESIDLLFMWIAILNPLISCLCELQFSMHWSLFQVLPALLDGAGDQLPHLSPFPRAEASFGLQPQQPRTGSTPATANHQPLLSLWRWGFCTVVCRMIQTPITTTLLFKKSYTYTHII